MQRPQKIATFLNVNCELSDDELNEMPQQDADEVAAALIEYRAEIDAALKRLGRDKQH